jgi:RHS repeat-associated protein
VFYYYQDKLGSTTQVANASGALLESYRYDLYGTPSYYRDDMKYDSSIYGISDLYAGERWASELSLYDLRNRFMSPELGRFLQTDPIGFKGDASNLYRYCGNDPVDKTDPMGLEAAIGSTIAERMRLFYGDGGRGNLWELDHPKDASLTMATLPRNDSLTHGMHFVPTRLSEDGKTAYPTTSDHTGGRYEYQLTKDGKRESGRGYTVLEKLSPVPGVVNNVDAKIKQEKWRPLQSNGIFPDAVGIGFRPSHSVNKVSVVYQTFELKYNNQPVSVSTRFIHDVRYDPSGQLRVSVLVDRP